MTYKGSTVTRGLTAKEKRKEKKRRAMEHERKVALRKEKKRRAMEHERKVALRKETLYPTKKPLTLDEAVQKMLNQ